MLRIELERPVEMRQRLGQTTLRPCHTTKRRPRGRVVGIGIQDRDELRLRLFKSAEVGERAGQIEARLGAVGGGRERTTEIPDRLATAMQPQQRRAEITHRLGVVRRQLQRRLFTVC